MKKKRQLSVATRLHVMIAMIIVSGGVGVFGALQIARGADMHKLNFLHVQYNHSFNRKVEAFDKGELSDIAALSDELMMIRQQPLDCLASIGRLERLIMTIIGTQQAIRLCEMDLELTSKTLDACRAFEEGTLPKEHVVGELRAAGRTFQLYSEEFEPLVEKTVVTVSRVVMWTVVLKAIILAVCGIVLSRSVAVDYARLKLAELSLADDIRRRKHAESERDRLDFELQETARRAGMAEVATGVLHNVGNVLNSLNISSVLISQRIKASPVPTLRKAADMISLESESLFDFFENDERGKHFPELITKITVLLEKERNEVLKEFGDLMMSVDHIKAIVSSQQAFARRQAASEPFDPVEIFEDAIRMNEISLQIHNILVVREFEACGEVNLQKHSVLQILVNLIQNAQQALEKSRVDAPCLRLLISREDGFVRLVVSDNGVGISCENITNIFSHGFTTKKSGHGFGLHACANSAQEMGGSLSVHSDGVDKGCSFVLRLPIDNVQDYRPVKASKMPQRV